MEGRMPPNKIIFTREEVYDLVWSMPMIRLVKKYVTNNKELMKICLNMEVPIPYTGYWNRVARGQVGIQTELPPASEKALNKIVIPLRVSQAFELAKSIVLTEDDAPHPLIAQTRKAFEGGVLTALDHSLKNPKKEHLDLKVTPGTLERSLEVMNILLKTLESHGFKFKITPANKDRGYYDTWNTYIDSPGSHISFSLSEETKAAFAKNLGRKWTSLFPI